MFPWRVALRSFEERRVNTPVHFCPKLMLFRMSTQNRLSDGRVGSESTVPVKGPT
jgi:hypothetical protein